MLPCGHDALTGPAHADTYGANDQLGTGNTPAPLSELCCVSRRFH